MIAAKFRFLHIDLFFHPSKQQQELNNEMEIVVSINAESIFSVNQYVIL